MKDFVIVTIPSNPKYLSVIRSVTATMGGIYGFADKVIEEVKLAVDEACSNVIKYAYRGDTDQEIIIKFILQKGFEVVIEDRGIKANPELIEGRSLSDVRPGGLGIHLIKRAFDVFSFDEKRERGNRLRLIRHRGGFSEDRDS